MKLINVYVKIESEWSVFEFLTNLRISGGLTSNENHYSPYFSAKHANKSACREMPSKALRCRGSNKYFIKARQWQEWNSNNNWRTTTNATSCRWRDHFPWTVSIIKKGDFVLEMCWKFLPSVLSPTTATGAEGRRRYAGPTKPHNWLPNG